MSTLIDIPVKNIQTTDVNPRKIDKTTAEFKALQASIDRRGLLQPIVVTAGASKDEYLLVAGERRLTAVKALKKETIAALVRAAGDELEAALEENVHREALTPVEEAIQYQRLIDNGLTPKGVAEELAVAQKRVTERLPIKQRLETETELAMARSAVALNRAIVADVRRAYAAALETIEALRAEIAEMSP